MEEAKYSGTVAPIRVYLFTLGYFIENLNVYMSSS